MMEPLNCLCPRGCLSCIAMIALLFLSEHPVEMIYLPQAHIHLPYELIKRAVASLFFRLLCYLRLLVVTRLEQHVAHSL